MSITTGSPESRVSTEVHAEGLHRLEEGRLRLRARGDALQLHSGLAKLLREGALRRRVGNTPVLTHNATQQFDPRNTRVVLVCLNDDAGRPAAGVPLSLLAEDGTTLLDRVRTDRRGLALLRSPAPRAVGLDLPVVHALEIFGDDPVSVTIPAGSQHVLVPLTVPVARLVEAVLPEAGSLATALERVGEAVTALEGLVTATTDPATAAVPVAASGLASLVAELTAATGVADAAGLLTALAATVQGLIAASQALAAEVRADAAFAAAANRTFELIRAAIEEIATTLQRLQAAVPDDSVVSRLPIVFSPGLADSVTRLLTVAEGAIPGLSAAVAGISTSRTPLIKTLTLRRLVRDADGVHRLLVRVRQEWFFVGYTLGELARVDSRDPGTVLATLDATLDARISAQVAVDARTASRLQLAAEAGISAWSSIDTTLDFVTNAKLDAKLRVGARDDDQTSGGDFLGDVIDFLTDPGNEVADALLPDVGADLDATLDVSGHAALSIDSSLLVSAKLNAAASLTNQLSLNASATAQARLSLRARASASINPSLSRALNLLRFVLYENYAVSTAWRTFKRWRRSRYSGARDQLILRDSRLLTLSSTAPYFNAVCWNHSWPGDSPSCGHY